MELKVFRLGVSAFGDKYYNPSHRAPPKVVLFGDPTSSKMVLRLGVGSSRISTTCVSIGGKTYGVVPRKYGLGVITFMSQMALQMARKALAMGIREVQVSIKVDTGRVSAEMRSIAIRVETS